MRANQAVKMSLVVSTLAALGGCAGVRQPMSIARPKPVDISDAIRSAIPVGYNGAEGKIQIAIVTAAGIKGRDAGFFVELRPPIEVGSARYLTMNIRGDILQRQGWDHYGSIQLLDGSGKRHIVLELCREGKYGSCAGKPVTDPGAVGQGVNLRIPLLQGLKNISRLEIVFVGETEVSAGFTVSDIRLER